MKKKLALLFVIEFVLVLFFTQWAGESGYLRQGVVEAKVIQEKEVLDENATVFDETNPQIQAVMAVQERHTDALLAQPGIVGTATGLCEDGKPAMLVFVKSFESARSAFIPSEVEGIPCIVKITGEITVRNKPSITTPLVDPSQRFNRPVPIGASTGHPAITAGTIGCRVTDGTNFYALSNNHVYADSNSASLGDNVLQPGDFDGGTNPADAIGRLSDFEPINFSLFANNEIDAAIARTSRRLLRKTTPNDGYGRPRSQIISQAQLNQWVIKYGRTTGLTVGRITGINATVNVNYGGPGIARFVKQIVITPGSFSGGGDSGSLIVSWTRNPANRRRPVGLLFAGSSTTTIANPIAPVLNRFGVTVDGR